MAMVLEAWAGNDERVEREWQAACAQAEELEAGSVPSAATESLLVATRRRRLGEEQGDELLRSVRISHFEGRGMTAHRSVSI